MPMDPLETDSDNPVTEDGRIEVARLLAFVRRHWKAILGGSLGLAVVAVVYITLFRTYVAESEFLPDAGGVSQLAMLAAQFGVPAGATSRGESPDFYARLFESREILARVVQKQFKVPKSDGSSDTLSGNLIQIFKIKGPTATKRLESAVDALHARVAVSTDLRAGVVTVDCTARWPRLAEAINSALLDVTSEFNVDRRQTRAHAERLFVAGRLETAERDLRAAEDSLQQFLQRNRTYRESPALSFEAARLQRTIDLRQQIYLSLAQAGEQARLDEVRNTPVITIVDSPVDSARPANSRIRGGLMGLILGALLGAGYGALRDRSARLARAAGTGERAAGAGTGLAGS